MGNKLGRNELCHCGSGKKYKQCCLKSEVVSEVSDFSWRKLRQLEGKVIDNHLIPYMMKTLPQKLMKTVLEECLPEDLPEAVDKEILFMNFLMPWILFNLVLSDWFPFEDFDIKKFDTEKTIAENYLRQNKNKLTSDEIRFLESLNKTFYSFYVVLEVEETKSLLVKDILLETTHRIKEHKGTHFLKRGDIIYSRILTMDEQSIFIGMAPFNLPTKYHTHLLDYKKWLIEENDYQPLNPEVLRNEFDIESQDYFFEILISAFDPNPPKFMNTDNEEMQFCISHFKLNLLPEETLNHLLPMTLEKSPEDFLKDAKRKKSGTIKEIEFPWLSKKNKINKDWENTVLGHVTIKENKLTLETNSLERCERGRKLLEKLLGNSIEFQQSLIETPKQKMQSLPENKKSERINISQSPEIQEQLITMAKSYWENWFNQRIPALNNQTPREAAKTVEGREYLEALLLQYKRNDLERDENDPLKMDIKFIRKELSLKTDI